jgi:FtsH-binding integral membrane protein
MSQYPYERKIELEYATDERVTFNFFNMVYAWMAVGLAVTAVVAYAGSKSDVLLQVVYGNRFGYIGIGLAAFAIAWGVQSVALRISAAAATGLFLLYAAVIGALISGIFRIYPNSVLFSSFLLTGGVFGGMSVFGFITKRDLSKIGSILVMCVWGLILASIVNIAFFRNDALSWVITYGVLVVFIGLTAWDTQKLKAIALATQGNRDLAARYAIIGSLNLYVDFINIFLAILRILGSRR